MNMNDAIFAVAFVILVSAACFLAGNFDPDFDFFLTLFIDIPMQMTGLYGMLKWLLILSALAGLGFGFLTQVKDKRFLLGGAGLAGLSMVAFLGTNALVLATAIGLSLGIAISLKDPSHAAGNGLLLASLFLSVATFNLLSAEDRGDAVFDRLALQLEAMTEKMGGQLEGAMRQQAVAMADMLSTMQEQTIDATTVRYNQYLASQGLAIIPSTETTKVKEEFIDREALQESMLGQVQSQKVDTKELLRPMLYDQLTANLPLIGAMTMFSAFGVLRSLVAPIAGLFASLLGLVTKEKVKEEKTPI